MLAWILTSSFIIWGPGEQAVKQRHERDHQLKTVFKQTLRKSVADVNSRCSAEVNCHAWRHQHIQNP